MTKHVNIAVQGSLGAVSSTMKPSAISILLKEKTWYILKKVFPQRPKLDFDVKSALLGFTQRNRTDERALVPRTPDIQRMPGLWQTVSQTSKGP